MTAAAVEALRDLWEADDHVTSDQFRTCLAAALMLSGGYDRVDMEALVAASAARPEVAG